VRVTHAAEHVTPHVARVRARHRDDDDDTTGFVLVCQRVRQRIVTSMRARAMDGGDEYECARAIVRVCDVVVDDGGGGGVIG